MLTPLIGTYMLLLFSTFFTLNHYVHDAYTSSNIVASWVNTIYVYTTLRPSNNTTITTSTMRHFVALLIAYYIYDTILQLCYTMKNKLTFIVHHLAAIALLTFHAIDILPISIGFIYLNLIEYSNVFLIPFQICNHYNWKVVRGILAYPLFISYVPLRLIVIPYYSLNYLKVLWRMSDTYLSFAIFNLLLYVNVFSMYFACVMTHRFIQYHKKLLGC